MYIQNGGDFMLVTLRKWGNSEAIRIPKGLIDTIGFQSGDEVEITVENDSLIIKKPELKGRDLVADLLKDFKANDLRLSGASEDWELIGEERWDYEEN